MHASLDPHVPPKYTFHSRSLHFPNTPTVAPKAVGTAVGTGRQASLWTATHSASSRAPLAAPAAVVPPLPDAAPAALDDVP